MACSAPPRPSILMSPPATAPQLPQTEDANASPSPRIRLPGSCAWAPKRFELEGFAPTAQTPADLRSNSTQDHDSGRRSSSSRPWTTPQLTADKRLIHAPWWRGRHRYLCQFLALARLCGRLSAESGQILELTRSTLISSGVGSKQPDDSLTSTLKCRHTALSALGSGMFRPRTTSRRDIDTLGSDRLCGAQEVQSGGAASGSSIASTSTKSSSIAVAHPVGP